LSIGFSVREFNIVLNGPSIGVLSFSKVKISVSYEDTDDEYVDKNVYTFSISPLNNILPL
jgi:hypothetical protein